MIIISLEAPSPQPGPSTASARLSSITTDPLDPKLIEAVGQEDGRPVPLWPVIHEIVEDERPGSRIRRRQLIGRVLCRVRTLLRQGILTRDGTRNVRLSKPVKAAAPAPPPVRNVPPALDPTVMDMTTLYGGGPRRVIFKA